MQQPIPLGFFDVCLDSRRRLQKTLMLWWTFFCSSQQQNVTLGISIDASSVLMLKTKILTAGGKSEAGGDSERRCRQLCAMARVVGPRTKKRMQRLVRAICATEIGSAHAIFDIDEPVVSLRTFLV
jgi:hypothetical protein